MNIAIDIRALMHGHTSGVEMYLTRLLEQILSLDDTNHYYLYYNSRHAVDENIYRALPFARHHPRVTFVKTTYPNKIWNLLLTLGLIHLDRLIIKKTGIRHLDLFWLPDPRPVVLSPHCQLITTIHDLSWLDYPQGFNFKTRLWQKLIRTRRIIARSHKIIAVSDFTRKRLNHYGVPLEKITVIHEGADQPFPKGYDKARATQIKRRYFLEKPYIMTLSTLEPRKNLPGLIKEFIFWKEKTQLPHQLVIVGEARPEIFQTVELPSHPDIIFTGYVPEETKYYLYHEADLFVFLSFYEGFGLPLVEAMSTGTAIITSDCTSLPEIVGQNGLTVDPHHPKLDQIFEYLLTRPRELHKLKTAALERSKVFSWLKCAKETLKVFETN